MHFVIFGWNHGASCMTHFANFAAFAIHMALTPGPNMAYLVSRSICQGRPAGLVSLGGVVLGSLSMYC